MLVSAFRSLLSPIAFELYLTFPFSCLPVCYPRLPPVVPFQSRCLYRVRKVDSHSHCHG